MNTAATLQVTTPSDREIAMTRVFNAPRELVFKAMTTPELIQRWLLGPEGWAMPICEVDLRVGGKYRYGWKKETGQTMAMGGVFKEIAPPERIVCTEIFDEPWYEGEAVVTTHLVEKDGRTTMTVTVLSGSKEIRDGVLKSGMVTGAAKSYDRLAELVESGS